MVAPLVLPVTLRQVFGKLTPRIEVRGTAYLVLVPSMSSMQRRFLGEDVADLSAHADEITAATDFLFQGF